MPPNGCELPVLGPQAQVSGSVNLHSKSAFAKAGSAPASC